MPEKVSEINLKINNNIKTPVTKPIATEQSKPPEAVFKGGNKPTSEVQITNNELKKRQEVREKLVKELGIDVGELKNEIELSKLSKEKREEYLETEKLLKLLQNPDKMQEFLKTKKAEIAKSMKEKLAETKKKQGFIGKSWNWIKNTTGIGDGSDKTQKTLEKLEKGEITAIEAQKALMGFEHGQKMAVDMFSTIATIGAVTGIMAAGIIATPFSAGTSLAASLAASATLMGVGAAVKAGVKATEKATGGQEITLKDIGKDAVMGGVEAGLTIATMGIAPVVSTGTGHIVSSFLSKGGTKLVQNAVAGAVTGGAYSATTSGTNYLLNAENQNMSDFLKTTGKAGVTGAVFGSVAFGIKGQLSNYTDKIYLSASNSSSNLISSKASLLAIKGTNSLGSSLIAGSFAGGSSALTDYAMNAEEYNLSNAIDATTEGAQAGAVMMGVFEPINVLTGVFNKVKAQNVGNPKYTREQALEALGLDPKGNYTEAQIKTAYRRQALVHHPDKGGNAESFHKVNEAYLYLSNEPLLSKVSRTKQKQNTPHPTPDSSNLPTIKPEAGITTPIVPPKPQTTPPPITSVATPKSAINLTRKPKFECDIPYQENNYYRTIGDGGYADFLETGLIRADQNNKFHYNHACFEKGFVNNIYARKASSRSYIVESNSPKIKATDSYYAVEFLDKTKDAFRIWKQNENGSYEIVFDTMNGAVSKEYATKQDSKIKISPKVECNIPYQENLYYLNMSNGDYEYLSKSGRIEPKNGNSYIYLSKGNSNTETPPDYIAETDACTIMLDETFGPKVMNLRKNKFTRIWKRKEDGSYDIVFERPKPEKTNNPKLSPEQEEYFLQQNDELLKALNEKAKGNRYSRLLSQRKYNLDPNSIRDLKINDSSTLQRALRRHYPLQIIDIAYKARLGMAKIAEFEPESHKDTGLKKYGDILDWYQATTSNSGSLNNNLRNDLPLSEEAQACKEFFDTHSRQLGENTVLVRVTNEFPSLEISKLKKGDTFTEKGFMSTARPEGVPENIPFASGKYCFIILAPATTKGIVAKDWNIYDGMAEVILPRNTKFEVIEANIPLQDYGEEQFGDKRIEGRQAFILEQPN